MNAQALKAQALPALLTGTGRTPLRLAELDASDPKAALKALSLAGQALRFERPAPPASFTLETPVRDERPILPDSLRRRLVRLLSGKLPASEAAIAVAWAMGRLKLRPHPFDLPKLDGFVNAHAESLGATAQQWASQRPDAPSVVQSYFDGDLVEDANWFGAPLARRAWYLEDKRRQDAAAARELLEQAWPHQNPDARVRLLAALQIGLNAADQPFLESLATDRAPRVRALAQRLMARLPGQSGSHPALAAVLERIQKSTTGLLRKRPALKLELPATVKEHMATGWVRDAFAEVSCDELARALHLSETAMIEAAEKDSNLLLGMALMATQDRRLDLLAAVAEHLPDAWERMHHCGTQELGAMSLADRLRWAKIVTRPYLGNLPTIFTFWTWLHRSLEGPGPAALIDEVLKSPKWLRTMQEEGKLIPEHADAIAALCPATHRERLRALLAQLAEVDLKPTATALPLLELLAAMEIFATQKKAGNDA